MHSPALALARGTGLFASRVVVTHAHEIRKPLRPATSCVRDSASLTSINSPVSRRKR